MAERILLVTIDTLRADRLGCYGDATARTPHIDTLATSGVRFETAISPAPLTLPAHASLMTGLDPPRHGVRHNSIHRLADDLPTLAGSLRDAGFPTAAFVGALVLDRRFGLDRGFDVYDDRVGARAAAGTGYPERDAEAVVDAALEWLASAPPRFFLWVHFYDPHAPYAPPPGFAAAFAADRYAGEIAFVDHQLGRLLAAIDARFGPGSRLVALASDHGESLGEHGERTHAYGVYDATQRVPLVIAGPGFPAGRVVQGTARLVDVAPTLLAAVGAAPLSSADGRDLAGLVRGVSDGDAPAYVETLATHLDYGWSPLVGLRTPRFKYIRAPRPELYDLAADPGETRDLAAERPQEVARLDAALEARLARGRSAAAVELEEAERARLRSLGYVVPDRALPELRPDRLGGPDPKDEIGLLGRVAEAEGLAARGRRREALALLDALEAPPVHVLVLRAAIRLDAGEPEPAGRDARAALARAPRRADAWLLLGAALERDGQWADALDAFRAAVDLDPRSVEGWRGVERCARERGQRGLSEHAAARVAALSGADRVVAPEPSAAGDSNPARTSTHGSGERVRGAPLD